jgi:hypothetical protein
MDSDVPDEFVPDASEALSELRIAMQKEHADDFDAEILHLTLAWKHLRRLSDLTDGVSFVKIMPIPMAMLVQMQMRERMSTNANVHVISRWRLRH